ncbi:hypothetical protein AKJ09_09968 [Labilithrix luteola]|uniref:Outer membrane lipoprotein BamD-like domain-containing protein n=1 Tax=Labilithrix luteola TaxID=1391654 RepID=A0A0K1QD11_9BACT|nr:hypothetical protein [Labilithrix luteola]AKV03305.1 hypothetical protein AKJ09_09968 [Labilithrix luteola]
MAKFDIGSPDIGDGDPLTNEILDSAFDDVPSAGARDRLLATFDLAPADAGTKQGSSPQAVFGGRYAQVVGLALAIGATAAVVSVGLRDRNPSHTPEADTVAAIANVEGTTSPASTESVGHPPAEPARSAPVSPLAVSAPPVTHERADTRPENRARPTARLTPAAPVAQAPEDARGSSLGREVARVTAARSALAAGDVSRTLALLDSYDAEFPAGTLAIEASVLRIEALARSGRRDEARRLGDQFLAQHPRGAFARRVESSLELASPENHESPPAR